MHPHHRHRRCGHQHLALRDLVLVVREDQVVAAAVDVERHAEQRARHRAALDVPARPPTAPRRLPLRLAGFRELPQREVERIALVLVLGDARADQQLVDVLAAERAVARKRRHGVVDAVFADVGVAGLDQLADHLDDLRHELRGVRLRVGLAHVEDAHRLAERIVEALHHQVERRALALRRRDGAVVDVGDVLHERHAVAVARVLQIAPQHVEEQERPRVAEVSFGRRREAADVDPDVIGLERRQLFECARAGVKQPERHSSVRFRRAALPARRSARRVAR